jgi:BirA family biotin operon repressor/biotin-[acetyl-CoA-carboxylase] ligase
MTSLAIVKTLQEAGLRNCRIKRPNDIYVGDLKIAGILIENIVRSNQLDWSILGIGLNVNQATFGVAGATSIKLELGSEQSLDIILDHLLKALNEYYRLLGSGKLTVLRDLYTRNLMWINERRIFLDTERNIKFEGIIVRVNPEGRLVVRSEKKELVFGYKQIAFIGVK